MKFYIIDKDGIEPKEHHIVIPFDYSISGIEYYAWLINLTDVEIKELPPMITKFKILNNFMNWIPCSFEVDFWDFIKTKHTFMIVGKFPSGNDYGYNYFDLDENDLMYMRLMNWF